jgi:hypothetical protein
VYLAAGQLPRINWLLKALVDGSLQQLVLGAADFRRSRRRR